MKSLNVMTIGQELISQDYLSDKLKNLKEWTTNLGHFDEISGAIASIATYMPDLVVLNKRISQDVGLNLLQECQNWDRYIPVIMLTGHPSNADTRRPLRYGADAYVSVEDAKSDRFLNTIEDVLDGKDPMSRTELKSLELETYKKHHLDPLTGLKNRTGLIKRIKREIDNVNSLDQELNLLFCGIENLVQVERQLSFHKANRILKQLSRTISSAIDKKHLAARYSDNCFAVLYVGLNYEASADRAASMLRSVRYSLKESVRGQNETPDVLLRSELTRHKNYMAGTTEFVSTALENYRESESHSPDEPINFLDQIPKSA
ncbi:MAG: diguanylate cyclase domain-containing protein [bacterium]